MPQGVLNKAGAVKRAIGEYNAPGSVDYSETTAKRGHGFEDASESEIKEYKKPDMLFQHYLFQTYPLLLKHRLF